MQKIYQVRERAHEDLLLDLLAARGITDSLEVEHFLEPQFERDSHDPFLLPDMERGVERILEARAKKEHICVWSDYDCDGIPGGVLLVEFLRDIGLSVRHYIPHRHNEGFGLNIQGIDELKGEGVSLIITVDLGTSDGFAIAHANTLGIDMIITDHHLPPFDPNGSAQVLPPALAIINPKRSDSRYPYDGLCGAGVAWKVVQALLQRLRADESFSYAEGKEKWLLDLAGIATLSDMVPLRGENRMLAHFGLKVLRRNRRPGLAALLSLLRLKPAALTEDDVGFMIAPRINAASRMDSPDTAARLLAAKDVSEASLLARELNAINDERKGVVASMIKEANKRLADAPGNPLIVIGNPKWRPGVVGIVANSLMEAHHKPVFIWGRDGADMIRGSCRTPEHINVVALMTGAADLFDHFGGHHSSGGFSLEEGRLHELLPRLSESYTALAIAESTPPATVIDRELDLAEAPRAQTKLKFLAPFGMGNEKPLFVLPRVSIARMRQFGKGNDHLELSFERDGDMLTGVSFFTTPDTFSKTVSLGTRADIVGHIESDWQGRPRLRVVDVL